MELSVLLSNDTEFYEVALGSYIESSIVETRQDRILAQEAAANAQLDAGVASDAATASAESAQASSDASTSAVSAAADASASATQAENSANAAATTAAALGNISGNGGASLVGFDGTTLDQILMFRLNRVVDSIASLRLLPKLLYGRAFVTGYYDIGDGGGGAYQLDQYDTTSADNGGTIIVAADGGRWKLSFSHLVSICQFGAVGDGAIDSTASIQAAVASGAPLWVPRGKFLSTQPITISGSNKTFICERGAFLQYNGTDAAIVLSGSGHHIELADVGGQWDDAPTQANAVIRYFNLQYCRFSADTLGLAKNYIVLHDATSQTENSGNNIWNIGNVSGGNCQYGIYIESHNSYTYEGDSWNVKVIYSALQDSLVVGAGNGNKTRFNEFRISPDAQGITPLEVNVLADSNYFELRTWAEAASGIAIALATGTQNNFVFAQPGVQGTLITTDNGNNYLMVPNEQGEYLFSGASAFLSQRNLQYLRCLAGGME